MKISVLIPTHNRPFLFLRCIESVFKAYSVYPVDLEIIVNNDSHDITEVFHPDIPVTYHYHSSKNISEIYKLLFDSATRDYVYFLEDDDILSAKFFKVLATATPADIYYFNYLPAIKSEGFLNFCKYSLHHTDKDTFLREYDDTLFQFGQICFKKNSLPVDKFPTNNFIRNDFEIFKALCGTFATLPDFLYTQTVDGQDNISFVSLNKDPRWKMK